MLPPGLETPTQVKKYYEDVYNHLIDSGEYLPFTYPWFTLGFGVILVYLLIDHRKSPALQALRIPIFGFLCAYSTWCVTNMRGRSAAAGYGVGLLSTWGTMWVATIMVIRHCQTDFKRMQYRNSIAFGQIDTSGRDTAKDKDLSPEEMKNHGNPRRAETGPVVWQEYPTRSFAERLDWVIDIFTNFRGVGWNFELRDLPPPPAWVEADLAGKPVSNSAPSCASSSSSEKTVGRTGIQRFTSRRTLFWYCAIRLILGYFALDLIKTLMHHDAYFWGYTHPPAPPPTYLPAFLRSSPVLLKSYRLLISLAAISVALHQILRCGPLLFGIFLGPSGHLGIRGEAWSNIPDFYGSLSPIFTRGLAGWWSGFWHQTFRYAFEAPTARLLDAFKIPPRSDAARLLGVLVAFAWSALLHFAGSYTQLGATRPFRGPATFFLLQPVGIFAQTYFVRGLRATGFARYVPTWLGYAVNFAFAHVWLYFTAPLLVDDFAEGGVWLYEPVPVSPLRGLGFGAPDDRAGRWWFLWDDLVYWRTGKGWVDTGFAF